MAQQVCQGQQRDPGCSEVEADDEIIPPPAIGNDWRMIVRRNHA